MGYFYAIVNNVSIDIKTIRCDNSISFRSNSGKGGGASGRIERCLICRGPLYHAH